MNPLKGLLPGRQTRSQRRTAATVACDCTEPLEIRQLMTAGISLNDGTLLIEGDDGENQARVWQEGGKIKVRVSSTSESGFSLVPIIMTKTYAASQVDEIVFYGRGADDRFENDTSVPSTAYGGSGDDLLIGGSGNDRLEGGTGDDQLRGAQGNDILKGGPGRDVLYGNSGNDRLFGESGQDVLYGGTGNDFLSGGDNNDKVYGQDGHDQLQGDQGNDQLDGGKGNDLMIGGSENDTYLFSGSDLGDDYIQDRRGNNTLDFESFAGPVTIDLQSTAKQTICPDHLRLTLSDSAAIDHVFGSQYDDIIIGNELDNHLYGRGGDDRLMGRAGNDRLSGGAGDDTLFGGSGRDRLFGGAGWNRMYGEKGYDVTSQNGVTNIEVPHDNPQTDNWSCGPNSAYRLLQHYGIDVSYEELRNAARRNSILSYCELGTTPENLEQIVDRYRNVKLSRETNFDELQTAISKGKPVLALLRVGTITLGATEAAAFGAAATGGNPVGAVAGAVIGAVNQETSGPMAVPAMHWVLVTHIDVRNQRIAYTDTNGMEKTPMSFSEFESMWNWSSGGIPGAVFRGAGVTTRTILY